MNNRKNYVRQLDESDCGAASLAMILKYYKSTVSITKIRSLAQTDQNGTTALGIIKAAKCFNLDSKAIRVNTSCYYESLKNIPTPFIAHIDKNHGLLHYVVVFKVYKNSILVADPDPSIGMSKVSYRSFISNWTGITLLISPGDKYVKIKDNTASLLQTAKVLLKQKGIILTIVGTTFITTFITILGAFFLQKIIDSFVVNKMTTTLTAVSIGMLVAYIFHGLFSYIQGYLSVILGQRLSIDILLTYIKHLFKLPISFFETRKIGEITSRFSDANNIISTLASTAITTLLNFGTIIVIGSVLFAISHKLFLISILAVPIYSVIIMAFFKKFEKLNNERMERNALLSSRIIEDLRGIESIKSMNIENKMYSELDSKFTKTLSANYKYGLATVTQSAIKDSAELIINLAILYLGSLLVIKGQLTLGQLIAFNALLGYFLGPIESIINLQDEIQNATVANTRLNQILLTPIETNIETNRSLKEGKFKNKISFNKVSFEYKYGQPILNDINMEIKENQTIAIVGLSGSGKSTIAKLLANFYKPTSGKILINGEDTSNLSKRSIRDYITYLPQSPYVFSGSVIDNISLGSTKPNTMEMITNAAKIAEIDDEIQNLPDGYLTNLSEDSGLSGGQMQRIAIARAVLSDKSVIVFDESTSNLDLITERRIIRNVMDLKDKTLIFIAHRLEIAKKADNIIVIKDGKIAEQGTHNALLKKNNYYAQLFNET
ncbi:peptide cleavage/export ABC transporter [uncultured Rummeliibacillus sp.]|uniref:peptide cleavage/export ABC transporter n=1 Tax=uncultured Rummeliibacillus sp. TaxID=762292 RepID=UPI002620312A|nr:peptide cleavage/export ABC transporter [uncultured Rummeliibacillus sp.]